MCSGSKKKVLPNICRGDDGILLELAASDDVVGFKSVIEEKGLDVDESGLWYGRRIGCCCSSNNNNKMGFEERTPLMIASLFGSVEVLKYILETGKTDVNRTSASDKATALHCAAAGASNSSLQVVNLLLDASADVDALDCRGNKPNDVVALSGNNNLRRRRRSSLLLFKEEEEVKVSSSSCFKDVSLPDINNGIYGSDEFRMYSFKVKPCSRAYSHDWTECPFVHPGENARRRDPRKYPYSCVPCPEFRKGSCQKGDGCEYAHGVFESWLHPAQYKTRLCKDEIGCSRKVCFFAHNPEELRPVYASTGSAMPSPKSSSLSTATLMTPPMSPKGVGGGMWSPPPTLQLPGSRLKMEEMGWLRSAANLEGDVFGGSPTAAAVHMRQQQNIMPFVAAAAVMKSRSAAMRSQSYIDRGAVAAAMHNHVELSPKSSMGSSPDGKLEWGVRGDELNKLRKSASFGIRSNSYNAVVANTKSFSNEPDVSWVNSLVRDAPNSHKEELEKLRRYLRSCMEEE